MGMRGPVCAGRLRMRVPTVILALAAMVGNLCAQDMGTPGYVFVVHPFAVHPFMMRGNLRASRFWTRSTIALVALDGAAKTADSLATRENIDGGGREYDPVARPFVHTMAVQVVAMAAMFGAETAGAYFLHRRRHDHAGRAVLVGGAIVNGLGGASSFRNRVAGR